MGRPINKRYIGADVDNSPATATYNTDASGVITAVTVTDGGADYSGDFSVEITGGASGVATISFTVVGGVVTAGSVTEQSGAFAISAAGVVIPMPVPDAGIDQPFQILGTGFIPGQAGAAAVFIVKQKSSRQYLCALSSDPTITGILMTADTATPASGQISIPVDPFGGAREYAKIVLAHRIKTFDNNSYVWSDLRAPANEAGEADLGTDSPR